MLVFKDEATFAETVEILSSKTRAELDEWEKQFSDFESQRHIYEYAIDDMERYIQSIENEGAESFEKKRLRLGKDAYYSQYVLAHKSIMKFGTDAVFSLKIEGIHAGMDAVLNKDGLIQIGRDLYEYKDVSIKKIIDFSPKKLHLLSEDITNVQKGIYVSIIETSISSPESNNSKIQLYTYTCTGNSPDPDGKGEKVVANAYESVVRTTSDYLNYFFRPKMTVVAENWYKTALLGWTRKRTSQLRILSIGDVYYSVLSWGINGAKPLDVGTNGELSTSITAKIYDNPIQWRDAYPDPRIEAGIIDVYGRHGSRCQMY